ncbi:MAG: FkbM family methyltransferase [Acidobacteriota bacterium]
MLTSLRRWVRRSSGEGDSLGSLPAFFAGLKGRGFAPRHVLDVGANEASWSRTASRFFPDARFTLIEPRREMAPALEKFCGESPGRRWIAAGAAGRCGESVLAVAPDGGSSSFLPGAEGAAAVGWEARTVPLVTLASVCDATQPPPDLVKLDVEGLELEVLEAAGPLLGESELFVLETSWFRFRPEQPIFTEVVAFMDNYGYVPYDICWCLRRPRDGALGLVDVAFARRHGALRVSNGWE